ncbi:MAG: YraN family protein [Deltaproteobacteria bacterium]|nr:YraN family protein [Deltaproteobacteria bacterium]MBW2317909.1 YraN family protein [Deltaproteobacteria bacterium]MBW2600788.1 YraN family protein [Deltaproteobacteria bacterium]OEU46912.1 MAG: YraN family protein [Desulfobacterales bacterium S7086C20]
MYSKPRNRPDNGSTNDKGSVGAFGESLAVKALEENGYKILELNHRSKLGEIDIIAKEKGVLAFVEVKARRTDSFGHPKLAVTPRKQRKISMVALEYLKNTGQMDNNARFDVVAVRLVSGQSEVEIIRNAFDLAY